MTPIEATLLFSKIRLLFSGNEAPRSPALAGRGIKAELRRSQPAFALKSFGEVRHAIHPCRKLQGILAKANKFGSARTTNADKYP